MTSENAGLPNSPEDIERVKYAIGEAITNIGAHGNNGNEKERIDEISDAFDGGNITADKAVEELNVVWRGRQQGGM